jgi:uncharacterized protein (DUF1800 family)
MSELTERAAVRRLYDRLGFGLGGDRLAAAQRDGFDSATTALLRTAGTDVGAQSTPLPVLDSVRRPGKVNGERPDKATLKAWRQEQRRQTTAAVNWWLDRMVRADRQGVERLTWFWHGHFATSVQKVKQARLMLFQNESLRAHALGEFTDLAQAMIIDPALLLWLDGNDNTAQAPNENLSREFMELFTLGHGHYTEDDVREAARALTGWTVNKQTGRALLRPRRHDAGSKHILGVDGSFDAAGLVTLILAQPASPDFVIGRLWSRLVSSTPPTTSALARLKDAYGPRRDVAALLRAVVSEPAFHDAASGLVKQPVEWAVGLMRALDVSPTALDDRQQRRVGALLRGLGQVPFRPPSVGGWPAGGAWLTTSAALSRIEAAQLFTFAATLPRDLTRTSVKQRPEAIRRLLGIDALSPRTADAIASVADRLPAAITVAACSPEYTVSA